MSATNDIKLGDRIAFLNESGGGVVLEFLAAGKVKVRTDDGFELPYAASELIPGVQLSDGAMLDITEYQAQEIKDQDKLERTQRAMRVTGTKPVIHKKQPKDDPTIMTVDLHLDKILDNKSGMSNAEIVDYQLSYFERMLSTAIREKKRKMIVIHGIGEGVLKSEVHKVLEYYPGVRFHDADPRRYGYGATEVHILTH